MDPCWREMLPEMVGEILLRITQPTTTALADWRQYVAVAAGLSKRLPRRTPTDMFCDYVYVVLCDYDAQMFKRLRRDPLGWRMDAAKEDTTLSVGPKVVSGIDACPYEGLYFVSIYFVGNVSPTRCEYQGFDKSEPYGLVLFLDIRKQPPYDKLKNISSRFKKANPVCQIILGSL